MILRFPTLRSMREALCRLAGAFLLLIVLIIFSPQASSVEPDTYSSGGIRTRFESKLQVCKKYPFYEQHIQSLERPSGEYVIYVFHDRSLGHNGGLGDRLGGLVTAYAFALRTRRTLLIIGDKSFDDAFEPYHPQNNGKYQYHDWKWSGIDKAVTYENMTFNPGCVNPRPGNVKCALDETNLPFKIVKFRGNRAYICRWWNKPDLVDTHHLKSTLGIDDATDLFEVAGCILRLCMWPSEKLWNAVDQSMRADFQIALPPTGLESSLQVGMHFRCGDSSFKHDPKAGINKECVYSKEFDWKGTQFSDDHSPDSPIDAATCGKNVLASRLKEHNFTGHVSRSTVASKMWAYIASDYQPSAQQIKDTLSWGTTIKPPHGCHVDLQASDSCTLMTSVHWLMLALSDYIVMQSMVQPPVSPYTDAEKNPPVPHEPMPISAFSRYAAIYSLSPDGMRLASHCNSVNMTRLSRQTQGNWVCNPRTFF